VVFQGVIGPGGRVQRTGAALASVPLLQARAEGRPGPPPRAGASVELARKVDPPLPHSDFYAGNCFRDWPKEWYKICFAIRTSRGSGLDLKAANLLAKIPFLLPLRGNQFAFLIFYLAISGNRRNSREGHVLPKGGRPAGSMPTLLPPMPHSRRKKGVLSRPRKSGGRSLQPGLRKASRLAD